MLAKPLNIIVSRLSVIKNLTKKCRIIFCFTLFAYYYIAEIFFKTSKTENLLVLKTYLKIHKFGVINDFNHNIISINYFNNY